MAAYTVDARPRVRKALRQLDPKVRKDVLAKMRALTSEPRPVGAESLQGHPPWLRVRAGDYRIIYAVDDQARVVTVAIVGHRRDVYRRLDLLASPTESCPTRRTTASTGSPRKPLRCSPGPELLLMTAGL